MGLMILILYICFGAIVYTCLKFNEYFIKSDYSINDKLKFAILTLSFILLLSIAVFIYTFNLYTFEKNINNDKVKDNIDNYFAVIESEECNWVNEYPLGGYYEYKYILKKGDSEYELYTKNRDIFGKYNSNLDR